MAEGEEQDLVSKMAAVTISREYGSGGGEIAARLAERLGWHLVDHEAVVEVARAMGVTEAEAEAYDEHVDDIVSRVLHSFTMLQSPVITTEPITIASDSHFYDDARRRVVESAADHGHAVIVGRGGQVLLASRPDVLHARIVAPLEKRIIYVMRRESLDHARAQARVTAKDRDRARFLSETHHKSPADPQLYDLVINTGVLDLDSAVDLLAQALERKARKLNLPAEELGPAAGQTRYAEAPGNFAATENQDASPTGESVDSEEKARA